MTEAERERAAIVEWLREQEKCITLPFRFARYAADAIERLDHHKEHSKHG